MSVSLNHTIVHAHDARSSAEFLADVLDRPAPKTVFGHFEVVELDNEVSLDFMHDPGEIAVQHYAFLVSEEDFDHGFGRIQEQGLDFWADPMRSQPGRINHHDGGRGVYFLDPNGHLMELITRPYGSG